MTLPKSQGENPEIVIIPVDAWTKVCSAVNFAKITNMYSARSVMHMTYVKESDPAPVGLNIAKWKIPGDELAFSDAITKRDIYLYSVETSLQVSIES